MSRHPPRGAQIATPQTRPLGQETCARLPAALDALIAAIFARIFARLEQLLALWQSGNLPPPPIRRPQSPTRTAAPHPPALRTRPHFARASAPSAGVIPRKVKRPRRPAGPPAAPNPPISPPRGTAPCLPPRPGIPPGRAPPAGLLPNPARAG